MIVISVRIQEEQVLLDPIESQQRLRVPVGDESQNIASVGMWGFHVRHDPEGRRPICAHAIDDGVFLIGPEYSGLEQFGIATMRPALLAGMLLLHRFPDSQCGSWQ